MTPPEPPRPHYYNVSCPEGHPLRGLRNEGYQALRCPTCGEGIFVLPRSPLPDPPAPSTLRPRRRRPTPAPVPDDAPLLLSDPPPQEEVEEVVWLDPETEDGAATAPEPLAEPAPRVDLEEIRIEDDVEPEPPRPAPAPLELRPPPTRSREPSTAPLPRPRRKPGPRRVPREEPAAEEQVVERPAARVLGEQRFIEVPEPSGPLAWAKAHRLGLVIVGVLALVVTTVGYRIWRQKLENLPQIGEASWDSGREALADGRFDEAKQELATAADAFARLGLTDERRSLSRQFADEAALLADRCRLQPDELIEEAGSATSPAAWASRFEAVYRGRSILLDTTIRETPATSPHKRYEVDFHIYAGRGPIASREGVIDLEGFQLFESLKPRVGQPVLFGGRIDALTFEEGVWHLRLAPESGVIMTSTDGLKQADWDPKQTAVMPKSGAGKEGVR